MLIGASGATADGTEAMQWLLSGDCKRAGDAINDGMARDDAKSYALAGYLYASTGCVAIDLPRAVKYYRRAVELGDREARVPLGVMYGLGEGVPQDYRAAYRWFTYGGADTAGVDPSIEAAGGYAMTVTQVARSKVTYPKNTRDEGTLFVTFNAGTGGVTLSREASTGPEDTRHLRGSTPFRYAIEEAYAEAVKQVARPSETFDHGYVFEVPWTFQLK